MKKPPSFRRFLLIMVFILEGLSLAIVIGFLFAMLDRSMQQEQVSRINGQQAELRLYLTDRLNYTYNRVKEIRFNNNIKIALLLGMHPKIGENVETLYPKTKGSVFYVRSTDGQYFPQPEDSHAYLKDVHLMPSGHEDEIQLAVNPHTFVYCMPIVQNKQIKGYAVGIYDPSKDPHFSKLTGAFQDLSLVYGEKLHLTDMFTHQPLAVPSHRITKTLTQAHYRHASDECLALLIGMEEFPALSLVVDNQSYRQQRWSMVIKLVFLCIPLLFLTFSFSFLILKRVTCPLDALAQSANDIAQSDAHPDLDTTNIRHAEFLYLTQVFNKVFATIRQRTADLKDANDNLLRQIDETDKLETQLRQVRKMEALGTLAGGIAHDFNNILFAILGYCELALEDTDKESDQRDNLELAIAGTRRASDLVHQILTFARQTDIERHPLNLTSIIKESLKLMRATLPTTIKIKTELKTDLTVLADPTQMHQIIVNLFTNASHAMQDSGGVLTIALENIDIAPGDQLLEEGLNIGPHAWLTVVDTGHGMAPETIERIFDPYYTTKKQGEGSGMGLSVVQGIVHNLNGAIRVDSAVDKGSTFHIYLPVPDQMETFDITADPQELSAVGGREHILIVDDELHLARMIAQMLSKVGYHVTPFNNPVQALEQFRHTPEQFDLVISDVTMPQMAGPDMAREMIKIRPNLPVLLCTGYNANITEETIINIGARALIHKPLVRKELCTTIRNALDDAQAA